jgi:RNA polymerase sigma factor (sigma-70 family)
MHDSKRKPHSLTAQETTQRKRERTKQERLARSESKARQRTGSGTAPSRRRAVEHANINGNRKGRRNRTPLPGTSQHDTEQTRSKTYEPEGSIEEQDLRDKKILEMANQARLPGKEGRLALLWVLALSRVYQICRWVVNNPHGRWTCYQDVDDLHVEVQERIHRYLPLTSKKFESVDQLWKWVYRLAFSRYVDGLRTSKRRCNGLESLDGDDTPQEKEPISEQASALESAMSAEMFEKLLVCLSDEDRSILIAWRCDGLTLEKLGKEFGIGQHREEVRRRVQRILAQVKKNHAALTEGARVTRNNDGYE